jgi:hypothetical protein
VKWDNDREIVTVRFYDELDNGLQYKEEKKLFEHAIEIAREAITIKKLTIKQWETLFETHYNNTFGQLPHAEAVGFPGSYFL